MCTRRPDDGSLGLTEARQISKVIIHPDSPDVVYVGSMGHTWGPSPKRGVFRTKDGGKTWEKVLFKSENTGCIDLVINPSNPLELFAAVWEFERKAWGAKTGGPESGIWRSLDGGDNWEEITRNDGLPEGMMGRIGLTISAADPKRVYALIDSETQQGLYRSDDLGDTWRFISDDANITARPFYFYHLHSNPQNADELWAPGNKLWRSTDAGKTWILEPGIKDDFQDIWIDPSDANRMIATCDGGTQVTLTGGKTWSTFANQSGVQFYRVDTDDQFPYRVYGNAQDLSGLQCAQRLALGRYPAAHDRFYRQRRDRPSHPETRGSQHCLQLGHWGVVWRCHPLHGEQCEDWADRTAFGMARDPFRYTRVGVQVSLQLAGAVPRLPARSQDDLHGGERGLSHP